MSERPRFSIKFWHNWINLFDKLYIKSIAIIGHDLQIARLKYCDQLFQDSISLQYSQKYIIKHKSLDNRDMEVASLRIKIAYCLFQTNTLLFVKNEPYYASMIPCL